MSTIDLKMDPEALMKRIVSVAIEQRCPWVGDWCKNYRRIAGFTEDDVENQRTSDIDNVFEDEPYETRYATSFNISRNFFYRLLGRIMGVLTNYQVLAASERREQRDAADIGADYLRSRTSVDSSGKDFESLLRTVGYLFAGGPAYCMVRKTYDTAETQDDVELTAILPVDVYYFPGIMDINESPAIVVDQRVTQTVIEERYPKLAEMTDFSRVDGSKWPDDCDLTAISPKIDEGLYTLRTLLVRPSVADPKGREHVMLVGAPGIVHTIDKLDTQDGKYPLVMFADIPMGPFVEDRGRLTISSRLQQLLDVLMSKSMDIVVDGPQHLIGLPVGSGVTEDDYTNKAQLFYNKIPGNELVVQEVPGVGSIDPLIDRSMQLMAEMHAQNPASRGQSPGERTSGKALESLVAADAAVDAPFMAMMRRSIARTGKRTLLEMQGVEKPKKFVSLGRNDSFKLQSFNAADLTSDFEVRVRPGKGLPDNNAAKAQLVIKGLGDIPLFSDSPEAIRARDILGMSVDTDRDFDTEAAEEKIIRMEEVRIDEGEAFQPDPTDNNGLHLYRHRQNYIQRRADGGMEEGVRVASLAHIKMHEAIEQANAPPPVDAKGKPIEAPQQ